MNGTVEATASPDVVAPLSAPDVDVARMASPMGMAPPMARRVLADCTERDDSGPILSPLLATGQAHGGLVPGVTQVIREEFRHDPDKYLLSSNLAYDAIVSACALPSFERIVMQTPTPLNELGTMGLRAGHHRGHPRQPRRGVRHRGPSRFAPRRRAHHPGANLASIGSSQRLRTLLHHQPRLPSATVARIGRRRTVPVGASATRPLDKGVP